jgi:hypothetical protein
MMGMLIFCARQGHFRTSSHDIVISDRDGGYRRRNYIPNLLCYYQFARVSSPHFARLATAMPNLNQVLNLIMYHKLIYAMQSSLIQS